MNALVDNGVVDMLRMTVAAGEGGPLISMSGEADMTCVGQMREVLSSQLASGSAYLTIDASELTFADSGAIGVLTGIAMTLRGLGGRLILLHPRDNLVRILKILGADQMLTIIPATDVAGPSPAEGSLTSTASVSNACPNTLGEWSHRSSEPCLGQSVKPSP